MATGNANDRGAWAVGTTYAQYDVVTYGEFRYMATAASTGAYPDQDTTGAHWTVFEAVGGEADPATGQDLLSVTEKVVTISGNYTAKPGDIVIGIANGTVTLPQPVIGSKVEVWSNGASITLTVQPDSTSGAQVNGGASVTVTTQYTKKTFVADGFNWFAA